VRVMPATRARRALAALPLLTALSCARAEPSEPAAGPERQELLRDLHGSLFRVGQTWIALRDGGVYRAGIEDERAGAFDRLRFEPATDGAGRAGGARASFAEVEVLGESFMHGVDGLYLSVCAKPSQPLSTCTERSVFHTTDGHAWRCATADATSDPATISGLRWRQCSVLAQGEPDGPSR